MHIQYTEPAPGTEGLPFRSLIPGQWYEGCQSGRLYFYYESPEGKPRLLRCDDNIECTARFQRAGTFRPVTVTLSVRRSGAPVEKPDSPDQLNPFDSATENAHLRERLRVARLALREYASAHAQVVELGLVDP